MDRVWVITHERFRQDGEFYDVIAAFETEREAHAAMIQYGSNIKENEYNEISHDCTYGSTMYHIKENDFSLILTQEDILRVVPVEIKKFDFKQNKILEYASSN